MLHLQLVSAINQKFAVPMVFVLTCFTAWKIPRCHYTTVDQGVKSRCYYTLVDSEGVKKEALIG